MEPWLICEKVISNHKMVLLHSCSKLSVYHLSGKPPGKTVLSSESFLFLFSWKSSESHPFGSETSRGAKRAQIPLFIPVDPSWKILMLHCAAGLFQRLKSIHGWQMKHNSFPRTLFAKIFLWNFIIPDFFLSMSQTLCVGSSFIPSEDGREEVNDEFLFLHV